MSNEFEQLDLIDLLSERHLMLRKLTEKRWNDHSDVQISNSEWFILARIYKMKLPTLAALSKSVDISRQATHKFVKKLEEKGLVEVMNVEHNNKEKCLRLTSFGESCFEKNESLKGELINKIVESIGEEKMKFLMEVLKLDWGLNEKS